MLLTDTRIKALVPQAKPKKFFDGGGLYLLLNPNGSRWWRIKYRFGGKEQLLSLGIYPEISLKRARERRIEVRQLLANGIDPSVKRQAEKSALEDSFEAVAREWLGEFGPRWTSQHKHRILRRLEIHIFRWIGRRPVGDLSAQEVLNCVRRIKEGGALDTAHRALQNCGSVFRYAVATKRAERDPTRDLQGALPPSKVEHHASITDPTKIGPLLRAIDGYEGTFTVKTALKLAPLVFVRPVELRTAKWEDIDLKKAEWKIPAERMKMREKHVVPLSAQAVALLTELHQLTGPEGFVFPGLRTSARPMSENTVNGALRRLGYTQEEMTGHGFRSMASTLLNEQGFKGDAIERQLAHSERDESRDSYNFAQYLPERVEMMQAWADYLDELRTGKKKLPPKQAFVQDAA